jgi:hypothetical protein
MLPRLRPSVDGSSTVYGWACFGIAVLRCAVFWYRSAAVCGSVCDGIAVLRCTDPYLCLSRLLRANAWCGPRCLAWEQPRGRLLEARETCRHYWYVRTMYACMRERAGQGGRIDMDSCDEAGSFVWGASSWRSAVVLAVAGAVKRRHLWEVLWGHPCAAVVASLRSSSRGAITVAIRDVHLWHRITIRVNLDDPYQLG